MAVDSGTSGGVLCLYADTMDNWMYVGGGFSTSGSDTLYNCGGWNDTLFAGMGMSGNWGTNDSVWCFTLFKGNIYAGGSFTTAGGVAANHIAMWDGVAWHAVGNGFNSAVHTLAVYNDSLYAGGDFTASGSTSIAHIAKWNGTKWHQVSTGVNDDVDAMYAWKNALYISGDFTQAGSLTVNHICKWNDTAFSALGSGLTVSMMMMQCMAHSMVVYNGNLYVGGMFDHAGGTAMNNIAKWNGSNWSSIGNVGTGMGSDIVSALCAYNGSLYVGGNFSACASTSSNNLGVWNGSGWSTIGSGMNGSIHSMAVYNNKLYFGGTFSSAAGTSVRNLASYSTLTGIEPVNTTINGLLVYPNPSKGTITFSGLQANGTLFIYDALGRTINKQTIGSNKAQIDLSGQTPGAYLYRIVGANGQPLQTGKFMLQ